MLYGVDMLLGIDYSLFTQMIDTRYHHCIKIKK